MPVAALRSVGVCKMDQRRPSSVWAGGQNGCRIRRRQRRDSLCRRGRRARCRRSWKRSPAKNGFRLAANYEALPPIPGVDAVVMTTPHSIHSAQVIAAAAAKKTRVFARKPFTLTKKQAQRRRRRRAQRRGHARARLQSPPASGDDQAARHDPLRRARHHPARRSDHDVSQRAVHQSGPLAR